jgi:hypothetical protein
MHLPQHAHAHRYTCGTAHGSRLCWEVPCNKPIEILCPVCVAQSTIIDTFNAYLNPPPVQWFKLDFTGQEPEGEHDARE